MSAYPIQVKQTAHSELGDLPSNVEDRLTTVIQEVAQERKPTNHSKCEVLNNNHKGTLYKIKVGQHRAIAQLEKPHFRILKIGKRQGFYQGVDDIYDGL